MASVHYSFLMIWLGIYLIKLNRYFHSRDGAHYVLLLPHDPGRARRKYRTRSLVNMRADPHVHEFL
jgi:hypothetical protein